MILFGIYGFWPNPTEEEPQVETPISTTPTNYELKRMRMLSAFIENCREDRYPEWRCLLFAKLAGYSNEEITRNSNE